MKEALARIEGELAVLRMLRPGGLGTEGSRAGNGPELFGRPGAGMGAEFMDNAVAALWDEARTR